MRGVASYLAIVVLAFTLSVSVARAETGNAPQGIQWQTYSPAVFAESKTAGHPVLLLIKSASCHWCQEMEKTTWPVPAIIQLINANFIPVKLDIATDLKTAAGYGITAMPSTLILDADNKTIKLFKGYFTPDEMLKNLHDVLAPHAGTTSVEQSAEQPAAVAEKSPTAGLDTLAKSRHDQLVQQINVFFVKPEKTGQWNLDTVKYALSHAEGPKSPAYTWLETMLNAALALQDPVWGGFYNRSANGDLTYDKSLDVQSDALRIYALAYAYFHHPAYLKCAQQVLDYVTAFLKSPEGVFYTRQQALFTDVDKNRNYYQLNDMQRRQQAVPALDQSIYANENGRMIASLAAYSMVTGDRPALNEAITAVHWLQHNLSIPGGGFRHAKADSESIRLSDSVAMSNAYLNLYLATAEVEYLNSAVLAMRFVNQYFQNDPGKDGFISVVNLTHSTSAPPVLLAAENADVVRIAGALYNYTGDSQFQRMQSSAYHALQKPELMAGQSPALLLMAEERVIKPPLHITIIGSKSDPAARQLYEAAMARLPLNSRVEWWDKKEVAQHNTDVTYPDTDKATAYICHGIQCSLPIFEPGQLTGQIDAIVGIHTVPALAAAVEPQKNLIQLSDIISNSLNAEKVLADKHFILVILGFLGFGLLLSFTPCLLPLVPIMASIIVGNTIGVKKQKTFLLCLTYVVSMSFAYAILGVVAGFFGVYLQDYMQKPQVIVTFSLLFFVLALAMLDAYELSIPRVIQQKINDWSNLQEGGKFLGVMIMGILSCLIISPCVSAPLVGVLGFITKTGNYTLGAIGLFCMGFGMGIPLLIITLFSTNILPKASQWNAQIKTFFGIILLGASVWIITRILSEALTMLLWSAFIIFTTIYMGITRRKVKTLFAKLWKLITIMLFLYGAGLFYDALFISSDLYQLLRQHRVRSADEELFKPIANLADLEAAFQTAAKDQRPVMLDFSAKWCTACVKLNHSVFNDDQVKAVMHKFIVLRIDLSTMDPACVALARQFNVAGPPMIVFFNDHGKVVDTRAIGEMDADKFLQTLQSELITSK